MSDRPDAGAGKARGDVFGHVPHPAHSRRRCVINVERRETDDALGFAVFENREVLLGQATDRLAVLVEDGDVELDDLKSRAE